MVGSAMGDRFPMMLQSVHNGLEGTEAYREGQDKDAYPWSTRLNSRVPFLSVVFPAHRQELDFDIFQNVCVWFREDYVPV